MLETNNECPHAKNETLDEPFLIDKEHKERKALANKYFEPIMIPISELIPFSNNPFRLYEGERLGDMVESISKNGILNPIIVRTVGNGIYEILSGHNRVNAAKLAGHVKVPVVIKENINDDEAMIYVTASNLMQRSFSDMRHSEKASVLAAHYSKIFSQGKRSDILCELNALTNPHDFNENSTCAQSETKLKSRDVVASEYGLSRNTVARYLRINQLTDSMKTMLDNGRLGFIPAVTLSFLSVSEQESVKRCVELNEFKINIKKAELLRSYSEHGKLNEDNIYLILSGELGRKLRTKSDVYIMKKETFAKYFSPDQTRAEIDKIINEALDMYFQMKKQEQENASIIENGICTGEHDEELEL